MTRAWLTREKAAERFGANIAAALPYETPKLGKTEEVKDPRDRVAVWEVWEKDNRTVSWYVKGYPATLDEKVDPLGLRGFFPCPRPMMARPTTLDFAPRADFLVAQQRLQLLLPLPQPQQLALHRLRLQHQLVHIRRHHLHKHLLLLLIPLPSL